ncbi:MAG: hypothetical protein U1F23_07460 [Lysobacterales bacterium]
MTNPGGNIVVPVTVQENSSDPWTLVVNGNSVNNVTNVDVSSSAQTIEWNLVLNAQQKGSFNTQQSTPPGFAWTTRTQPAGSIFSGLTVGDTQIKIQDTNNSSSTAGDWTYKLCATVNGHPCVTNPVSLGGIQGDPKIKNR